MDLAFGIFFLPRGSARPERRCTSRRNERINSWEDGVAEPRLVVQVK